ncbi:MaoC/PaaZ C-terminal domain-containing protein [Caballeronia ptereochthonis]|uniref:MaoC family dehydratase n=1 Tax=Caballeronia ptereochthonis TaxID=1777144 RepID=A0A158CD08_9BURK|nr:MaoC/PaaZ C-terminal domain-containing protein [Caballeronia ptereochthonis]SAK80268.1 MaoC family dehydratase [Caballeronia ptereochthonis]
MPILLRGIDGIRAYAGFHLGKSGWVEIGQPTIDAFAAATDDRDALSVDPDEAARGPYGTTIAQNSLILAMVPPMLHDVFLLEDVGLSRQCGIDRLRFLAPVPVNSCIRLDATLKWARAEIAGLRFTLECTIECDCTDLPALQADISYQVWPLACSGVGRVLAL